MRIPDTRPVEEGGTHRSKHGHGPYADCKKLNKKESLRVQRKPCHSCRKKTRSIEETERIHRTLSYSLSNKLGGTLKNMKILTVRKRTQTREIRRKGIGPVKNEKLRSAVTGLTSVENGLRKTRFSIRGRPKRVCRRSGAKSNKKYLVLQIREQRKKMEKRES